MSILYAISWIFLDDSMGIYPNQKEEMKIHRFTNDSKLKNYQFIDEDKEIKEKLDEVLVICEMTTNSYEDVEKTLVRRHAFENKNRK